MAGCGQKGCCTAQHSTISLSMPQLHTNDWVSANDLPVQSVILSNFFLGLPLSFALYDGWVKDCWLKWFGHAISNFFWTVHMKFFNRPCWCLRLHHLWCCLHRRCWGWFHSISFLMLGFFTVILLSKIFCRHTIWSLILNQMFVSFQMVLSCVNYHYLLYSWNYFYSGLLFMDNQAKIFELVHYFKLLTTNIYLFFHPL